MRIQKLQPALLVSIAIWIVYTLYLCLSGTRLPGSDVFIFKEAGVNLALRGKFVVSNLPYMDFNQELTYYFYPPVYPFLFGIYTKLVGFGLAQGMFFDCLIRLIRTLIMGFFVWKSFEKTKNHFSPILIFCFLALSLLTSDGDRPDDLAFIFGFLSFACLISTSRRRIILSGLFLGLCAGTSGAAGAFFAIAIAATLWPWKNTWKSLVTTAGISIVTFVLILSPIYFNHPELYKLFTRQASISNFAYVPNLGPWTTHFSQNIAMWFRYFIECFKASPTTSFAAIVLLLPALIGKKRIASRIEDSALWIASLLMFAMVGLIWVLQPYYLWFAYLSLFVILAKRAEDSDKRNKVLFFFLCLSLVPKFWEEQKAFILSFQVPATETAQAIEKELRLQIPAGSRIATTPDQFYNISRENKVSNIDYVCLHLDDTKFVYLSRFTNSKEHSPVAIPCKNRMACFEVVKDLSQNPQVTFFGTQFPNYVRTSGGTLYRNARCEGQNIPWNVTAEEWLEKRR